MWNRILDKAFRKNRKQEIRYHHEYSEQEIEDSAMRGFMMMFGLGLVFSIIALILIW